MAFRVAGPNEALSMSARGARSSARIARRLYASAIESMIFFWRGVSHLARENTRFRFQHSPVLRAALSVSVAGRHGALNPPLPGATTDDLQDCSNEHFFGEIACKKQTLRNLEPLRIRPGARQRYS